MAAREGREPRREAGAIAAHVCQTNPGPWQGTHSLARLLTLAAALLFAVTSEAVAREGSSPTLPEEVMLAPGGERVERWFGRSVAICGSAVLVGSPSDGDGGTANGVVHVFGDSKRGWRRTQRLQSADPGWEDRFGQSVGADKSRVVVGRDRADEGAANAGAASVFRRVGSHFKREAELVAPDAATDAGFGGCVAVSGSTIVVGASRDDDKGLDAGSAYVWVLRGDEWVIDAKLTAPNAKSADWFGSSVAIDGNAIVVGAYGADPRGEKSGAAFVFRREPPGGWALEAELAPAELQPGDWFGFSVAISGDRVAIGAPRDDTGGESSGSVRIYHRTGGDWQLEHIIRPGAGQTTVWCGYSLAMSGPRLLVGMPGDDHGGESSGAVAFYELLAKRWSCRAILIASSPMADELFGSAVAIGPELAVVGRLVTEDGEVAPGRAWVFRLGGTPKSQPTTTPPAGGERPPREAPALGGAPRDSELGTPGDDPGRNIRRSVSLGAEVLRIDDSSAIACGHTLGAINSRFDSSDR